MAERKSVNKYYPPDWDPSKGSINEYVGQHPLRDRARKLGQGILIIRFEMPYNIWCGGCNNHIGMGVRYNAEKKKTGMYYTTPIYTFRMKCHLCDNHFEIQTDPKNHDYVILEGARRKEQRWDPKENGQIVPDDKAVHKKMALDAMFNLEHGSDDVQKGQKAVAHLNSVESLREQWKDDYLLNQLAREKFRTEKKAINLEALKDSALLTKSSLDIPLMDETEEDIKLAGLIKYRALETYDEKQAQKRKDIERQPMFEESKKAKTDSVNKKHNIIMKHLKTIKANIQNPFDTAKVNMYALPTALSKQALGIRKKNLPKYSVHHTTQEVATSCGGTNYLEPEQCHNNVDNHGFVYIDSPPLETTLDPDYIHTDSISNLASGNANVIDDASIDRKLDAVVERNGKLKIPMDVEDIIQEQVQDDDVYTNIDTDISDKVQSCANSNIDMEKKSLTFAKTSHERVTDICKTALSLVCTYSDSDSDTL